jgi:hypothetical protein
MPAWLTALGAAAKAAAPYAAQAGLALGQGYMDRRAQERAFEQNRQFWFERFEKEAQYNSPVQQKARMQAAGLNPALMYKGGQTGGSVSGGSAQGKIAERYALTELAKMSAEVKKIQAETDNIAADTNLKGEKGQLITEQRAGQVLANAMAEINKGTYNERNKAEIQKLTQDALRATAEREKAESEAVSAAYQTELKKKEVEIYKKVHENMIRIGADPNSSWMNQIIQVLTNLGVNTWDLFVPTLDK